MTNMPIAIRTYEETDLGYEEIAKVLKVPRRALKDHLIERGTFRGAAAGTALARDRGERTRAASREPKIVRWRRSAETHRRQSLRRRYGLTIEQFDEMLAEQGGVCAICGTDTPLGRGTFHVDHDHQTGQVRGLLCHPCNCEWA
jgi:ribosomal protein L24E